MTLYAGIHSEKENPIRTTENTDAGLLEARLNRRADKTAIPSDRLRPLMGPMRSISFPEKVAAVNRVALAMLFRTPISEVAMPNSLK